MGIFDLFKKKKTPMEELYEKMSNMIFPKGPKDIDAGTAELLSILNHKVSEETAKSVFLKSAFISRIVENFDEDRLRSHLAGYALQHFNQRQLVQFYIYLVAISAAIIINGITPSEVRRDGDEYVW